MMVVVANMHVRIQGIASGDMIRDINDRLGRMMCGLAAISESVEDRGSSTKRTECAFSRSLGGMGDRDRNAISMVLCGKPGHKFKAMRAHKVEGGWGYVKRSGHDNVT